MKKEKIILLLIELLDCLAEENRKAIESSIAKHGEALAPEKSSSLEEELVDGKEICRTFNISRSHLNNLKKRHKNFPKHHLGNSVRYKKSEIESFFKSLENGK